MRVRNAHSEDLDALVGFIAEEAREAEGRAQSQETLRAGIGTALEDGSIARYWMLLDESAVPCGCASIVKEWSDWNAGYYWWIQSMYIAPPYRGKGHISLLLNAIVAEARAQDCLELRLYVHTANKAAIRAYEKAGFNNAPYSIMSMRV